MKKDGCSLFMTCTVLRKWQSPLASLAMRRPPSRYKPHDLPLPASHLPFPHRALTGPRRPDDGQSYQVSLGINSPRQAKVHSPPVSTHLRIWQLKQGRPELRVEREPGLPQTLGSGSCNTVTYD